MALLLHPRTREDARRRETSKASTHDFSAQPDGSYVVSGSFDIGRLQSLLDFHPPEGTESTTVGGLVTEWLGHVPAAGETAERDGISIRVLSANQVRVDQVRVSKAVATP